jgi:HEAT repeat protein
MTLAARLRAPLDGERTAAIAELGARETADADEVEALVECLGHARKAVQRAAAEACAGLAGKGVPIRPALARALTGSDAGRRFGAAFALSLLGEPPVESLPVLLEALGAEDGDLRWAAADIVRRLRDRDAVVAALRPLVASGSGPQRKMALYCLRDLGARSPEIEQAALWALGDPEWDVRLAAVATLARLSTDRAAAADRLVLALEDDDPRLRRAAAAGLGLLGVSAATVLAALQAAVQSPDPALRRAAEGALRQLTAG